MKSQSSVFQRQVPKVAFSFKDVSGLVSKEWGQKDFTHWAERKKSQISMRNQYQKFTEQPEWNIYQLPKSDNEFKLWLNEATLLSYYKLSQAVETLQGKEAVLAAAAVEAFQFMQIFKFEGYGEEGQWTFSFKNDKEFVLNHLIKGKSQRLPAMDHGSLLSMIDRSAALSEKEKQALSSLKKDQTAYGEELSGHDVRNSIYTKGDSWSQDAFEVLDYIVGLTSSVGLNNSPGSFHRSNQELIDEIIEDVQDHPEVFGYSKAEFSKIRDFNVTDVDLHLLVQRAVHHRAKTVALWGAGISSVIGSSLSNIVSKARAWSFATLASMGVETIFMAYGSYQGIKQVYVLHRYYSYMKGRRKAAELTGNGFDTITAKQEFATDKIHFDRHFKMDAFRAWIVALGAGYVVKKYLNREVVQRFLNRATAKALLATRSSQGFLSIFKISFSKFYAHILQSSSWNNLFFRVFSKMPTKQVNQLLKKFNRFPFLGPANILLTLADFSITSISMYSLTYSILYNSSLALTQVDPSPSMSVQLSLASVDERNEDFYRATQEVLYPLCAHMSVKKKEDVYEGSLEVRRPRQQACLEIISAIEGQPVSVLPSLFPRVHHVLSSKKLIHLDYSQYEDLISKGYDYPSHYRVMWLSALRSIYGLKHIPESYGVLQAKWMAHPSVDVHGSSHKLSSFFRSPGVSGNYMNIERLNYAIELLAVDIERSKNPSQKRNDPVIADQIKSIHKAWIAYVRYYQKVTKDNMKYLLQQEMKREEISHWDGIVETLASFGDTISNGWQIFWKDPSDWAFRNQVRQENGLILNREKVLREEMQGLDL